METHQKLTCSVAMCTYNGAEFLEEQLKSFVNQKRLPDELIVCDDISSDNTMEILYEFSKTAPFPVIIIQNETNLGYLKNFEKSSRLCTGDIIFFSDQDDIWKPEKIQTMMEIFENQPDVGVVITNADLIDKDGKSMGCDISYCHTRVKIESWEKRCKKSQIDFICKYSTSSWSGMSMAYRNQYSEILYPFSGQWGHDTWIFKILGAITKIHFLTQSFTLYRIHGKNVVGDDKRTLSRLVAASGNSKTTNNYLRLSHELQAAAERLQTMALTQCNPKAIDLYLRKSHHCLIRYQIRTKQINKLYYILQETLNGNYFRFGRGVLSIGMDWLS